MLEPVEELVRALSRLPGLGRRSAGRAALALLREPERMLDPLVTALNSAREEVMCCSRCGGFTVRGAAALALPANRRTAMGRSDTSTSAPKATSSASSRARRLSSSERHG